MAVILLCSSCSNHCSNARLLYSQFKKYYDNPALKPDSSTEDQSLDDKVSASTLTHQGSVYGKLDISKK
jgi:hypothetical protein